jgi:hypothetical protein
MATVLGLNIKFAANTAGISKGAARTSKQLEGIGKSAKQATSALRGLVGIEVGKLLASGFTSAANAVSGFVTNVRESSGELQKLAGISNTSVESFQSLAIAAQSVGVEQNKLADIFKDVNDRVGDFLSTGGGPMADFFENIAPQVGVTAEQFAMLSGPEALQLYISSLEKAGLSQAEMTFYLEAMSSDLTSLLPLLQNGGKGFAELAERAERLGIILSTDQVGAIQQMNAALGLVYTTFESIIAQVTANLAPIVTAISEQFLGFVESFTTFTGGSGAGGIADVLTKGLLEFAKLMAGVFDTLLAGLESFGLSNESFSMQLEAFGKVLVTISEAFKIIFMSFENVGLALSRAFYNILDWFGVEGANEVAEAAKQMQEQMRASIDESVDNIKDAFSPNSGVDKQTGRLEGAMSKFIADFENSLKNRKQQEDTSAKPDAAPQAAAEDAAKSAWDSMPTRTRTEVIGISEEYRQEIQKAQDDYAKKTAEMEKARIEDLAAINQKALEQSDIRSGGISQVLAMATGREDPAVIEARKQLKELQALRNAVQALGGTVEIVGAA